MKAARWSQPAVLGLLLALWSGSAAAMGSLPRTETRFEPGYAFKDCMNCPEMVVLPAGTFQMGSPSGEEEREQIASRYRGRAEPLRQVTLPRSFAVGRTEVTRGEFSRFVAATGRRMEGCWDLGKTEWEFRPDRNWRDPGFAQSDRDPVVCVSWDDAREYARWISEQTRQRYRLLTEAEWEYAARANTATARYWGEEIGHNNANCSVCGSRLDNLRTAPVRSFGESPFWLSDMLGNAAEWVEDCWQDNYQGAPVTGAALTSGRCEFRVLRGGSWRSPANALRAGARARDLPSFRINSTGFRIARDVVGR